MMERDERAWAHAISDGDEAATREFVDAFLPPLYQFVYHRVDQHAPDAEDLTQDIMMTALKKIRSFEGRSALFTWLCGIAKIKLLDWYGRRERDTKRLVALEAVEESVEAARAAWDEELLERLDQEHQSRAINQVFSALPPHYQMCLTKKYFDGWPVDAIARELGETAKTIESRLTRARDAFHKAFVALARAEVAR